MAVFRIVEFYKLFEIVKFDEAKIAGFLNECLAPEIRWEKFTFEVKELNKTLGIYIPFPGKESQLFARKTTENLKRGPFIIAIVQDQKL